MAWTFEEHGIYLHVSDEGPGIAANHLDKVCEPFFTTSRNEGGTGLGLSIVKAIVDGCGGDFAIASAETGTEVSVYIPQNQPIG